MKKLWGRKSAFNVQKVMWALRELELDYEHIEVGGDFGGLDTPEFQKMNPHQKVPVIYDDGKVIWESHSIIRYLGSRYAKEELWSQDAYERSLSERWMDWAQAQLQPDFMKLFWGYYRMPESKRNQKQLEQTIVHCEHHFALLDSHLSSHPFLSGSHFTLGDIPAATALYRYFEMGVSVSKPKSVMLWYEQLMEREAYRETVMVPFDELFGKEGF